MSPNSNAFIRLIGVTYFTKHMPAFKNETPTSFFESPYTANSTAEEQLHEQTSDIEDVSETEEESEAGIEVIRDYNRLGI